MPSLVDEKEKSMLRFVSDNSLVEDPCGAEKERIMINPWTHMEKEVFLEKFATFGKNFKKIASYFDRKTTADCVEFYYKNHKSESFEKIKKSELKKQEKGFPTNTYLMTSGKKWNSEVNAASLVLLGEASVIAADADDNLKSQNIYLNRPFLGGNYYDKICWGDDASHEKSSNVDIIGNEKEATAADALAGICGALSSEAMSSCVTSSIDPVESCLEEKFQKSNVMEGPLTPVQGIDDEETCSDESCEEMDPADWTNEEKFNFVAALRSCGKDFMKIAQCVRSRSKDQCKIFFSKARKTLYLDGIHLGTGREGISVSDASGGRSDAEDACVYEMESAICSTQSCSKLDSDYPVSLNCETSDQATTNHLLFCDHDKLEGDNGVEQLNQIHSDGIEISGENSGTQAMNEDGVIVGEVLTHANRELDSKSEMNICSEDASVFKEAEDGPSDIMHLKPYFASKPSVDAGLTHSTEGLKHHQPTIDDESCSADGSRGIIAEDSCRVGDVKLFGQIITHPSTSQKQNLSKNKVPFLPKSCSKTFDLKLADRSLVRSNRDDHKYLGSSADNFPASSFGFWDGSRIQTGFSALPDSSALFAKYPTGFGDHLAASTYGHQQSFPTMMKMGDRIVTPLSVYSVQSASSSSMMLPEYQVYRGGYEGAKVQPFSVDMKRHDAFSELQKRNGLDICNFQQPIGVVGMNNNNNVMGDGLLSGGGGVSDPVAAIKMHYATTYRYATQNGSSNREEESWRRDVGR